MPQPYKKMKLTSQNVETLFRSLLFKDDENTENHVKASGVLANVGFHPDRLNAASDDIGTLLGQLPDEFQASKGGGMSFLNACMTREGDQWGEHRNIDQLLCMGIAAGKAKVQFPREMWAMFPGGMPYFTVLDTKPEVSTVPA